MVVFCPNAGLLSGIVLSLIPLLLPFHWQCLLLPVLPAAEGRLELMEASAGLGLRLGLAPGCVGTLAELRLELVLTEGHVAAYESGARFGHPAHTPPSITRPAFSSRRRPLPARRPLCPLCWGSCTRRPKCAASAAGWSGA